MHVDKRLSKEWNGAIGSDVGSRCTRHDRESLAHVLL